MKLHREEANNTHLLVVGLPNVGKTTFQDVLRSCGFDKAKSESNKYVPVNFKQDRMFKGGINRREPGTTGKVQEKVKVSLNPIVYVTDTPGIFHKKYPSPAVINKLSMTNIIQRKNIGNLLIADYILFELNRQRNFQYVKALNLKEPCDDLQTILSYISMQNNLHTLQTVMTGTGKRKIRSPHYEAAAAMFITANEAGLFGQIFWDQDIFDTERLAIQGTLLRYGVEHLPEGEQEGMWRVRDGEFAEKDYLDSSFNSESKSRTNSPASKLKLEIPDF